MSTGDSIKKHVGYAIDGLAEVWQKIRSQPGERAPVGGEAITQPAPGTAVAGISTGTLLMIALAWYMLKGRKR